MNKITVTLALVLFVAISCFGQQEAQYTQFMENKLMLNPAYAGARGATSVMVLNRNQWIGFEGAPNSQLISMNAPMFGDRVGVGLSISHHSIGITQNWTANMAYSYKIPITNDASLRIGVQGSMRSWGFDFANIVTTQPGAIDQSIPVTESSNSFKGNFGAGAYFNTKKVYFGVSAPYLLSNQIGFAAGDLSAVSKQHFYVMAGTAFDITDKLMLKPSVLGKYVENAPLDLDANLSLVYMYKFTAGLSYRLGGGVLNNNGTVANNGESIALVTGYQINNQFSLGLSYDFILSELNQANNNGSLEVLLRYDFRKDDVNLANPRFFF